ncbi:MAG: glycosyltransferase, partial [Candidatus Promineifilaceae bacterium]
MDIIVDGRIFELQSAGGISRLFRELLPRMCELDMSLKIHLLSARIMPVLLPQHPRIEPVPLTYWESALRPGRYFKEARWRGRKRAAARWLDRNRADVWHATYYTLPGYQSCPSVVSVYDMIYEQLPQVYSTREHVWTKSQKEQSIMSADALICISRTTRAELISYYAVDPARVRVIPLAASPVFREMDSINASQQSEQPYLLYIGSRTGYENAATLFAAYARWSLRFEIGLVVVGKPLTAEESS